MEKKKTIKTIVHRVRQDQDKYIKENITKNGFRAGLDELIAIHKLINRDPKILLQKELEHFGGLLQAFLPENHYEHYIESNLPAVINKLINKGIVDSSILNARIEKTLDRFSEKKDDKEKNRNV